MAAIETLDLKLRRRPTQQRAVATFDQILNTTAGLLEIHGFDSITTNLIAAESGISVRAIYRYFPNKHAIVGELARRMAAEWTKVVDDSGSLEDLASPVAALWSTYIDTFIAAVRATSGAAAVLLAMRSDPELRRVDDEANRRYIRGIADALWVRRPSLSAAEASAIATVLIRSTVAVLDEAFEADEAVAQQLIDTMKSMHIGLLAHYFAMTD
ncbi:MAG: TetR/AcrR family transcriptional regulator [Acidimicrobiales bacterium]